MVSVGAIKRNVLARRQVRVPVVLIARGAEPGSAKCAFGHTCCLPGGWRSLSATLDTRTRFPRARSPTPFQRCFLAGYGEADALSPGFAWLRGNPRVPLTALREDVAQQHHVIGHDAVRAKVEGPLDLLARVQRPH